MKKYNQLLNFPFIGTNTDESIKIWENRMEIAREGLRAVNVHAGSMAKSSILRINEFTLHDMKILQPVIKHIEIEKWVKPGWANFVCESRPAPNVERGRLFLGDVECSWNVEFIKTFNITHGINLSGFDNKLIPALVIRIDDSPTQNIARYFEQCNKYIDEHLNAGRNILVYCAAGRSRSVSICCAYLMAAQSMTFESAHDYLSRVRPVIDINPGFRLQLKNYKK